MLRHSDCEVLSVYASFEERTAFPDPLGTAILVDAIHECRRSTKRCKKERAHFTAILAFVYRNRFAVASQVQRPFSKIRRSGRTARRHLEELVALRFLAVAPARCVGPLFPKVYYVTGRGVRRLKKSLSKQGNPWQPSPIDRAIALALGRAQADLPSVLLRLAKSGARCRVREETASSQVNCASRSANQWHSRPFSHPSELLGEAVANTRHPVAPWFLYFDHRGQLAELEHLLGRCRRE